MSSLTFSISVLKKLTPNSPQIASAQRMGTLILEVEEAIV